MLRKTAVLFLAVALSCSAAPEASARKLKPEDVKKVMYELRESEEFPYTAEITGTRVNMRATPSTKGKRVGQISRGKVLVCDAEQNEGDAHSWYLCVNVADGTEGWMYGQYVRASDLSETGMRNHRFFSLVKLDIPLSKDGKPIGFGKPLSVQKDYIADFNATYWTYAYDGAVITVCEIADIYTVLRATVSAPGKGLGGIYCKTDWCDEFYVDKHLEGISKGERTESETENGIKWFYDAGAEALFTLGVTFGGNGLVREIEYATYNE